MAFDKDALFQIRDAVNRLVSSDELRQLNTVCDALQGFEAVFAPFTDTQSEEKPMDSTPHPQEAERAPTFTILGMFMLLEAVERFLTDDATHLRSCGWSEAACAAAEDAKKELIRFLQATRKSTIQEEAP